MSRNAYTCGWRYKWFCRLLFWSLLQGCDLGIHGERAGRSEFYRLLDFVIQSAVRGKYTAKIGELMHIIERVSVNCKGKMCTVQQMTHSRTGELRTSVFFVLTVSPARHTRQDKARVCWSWSLAAVWLAIAAPSAYYRATRNS